MLRVRKFDKVTPRSRRVGGLLVNIIELHQYINILRIFHTYYSAKFGPVVNFYASKVG